MTFRFGSRRKAWNKLSRTPASENPDKRSALWVSIFSIFTCQDIMHNNKVWKGQSCLYVLPFLSFQSRLWGFAGSGCRCFLLQATGLLMRHADGTTRCGEPVLPYNLHLKRVRTSQAPVANGQMGTRNRFPFANSSLDKGRMCRAGAASAPLSWCLMPQGKHCAWAWPQDDQA